MWVFSSRGFLSIVQKDASKPEMLTVRARVKGAIEAMFPRAKVQRTEGNDYLFRAEVPRELVAAAMYDYVDALTYNNFKNSIADDDYHNACSAVWHVMSRTQEVPPYSYRRLSKPDLLS